jgi:hypothetical protein
MTRMNIFTTDHPLTLQPSWFDTREYPVLSFVCSVFVSTLILTPLVLIGLYYYALSDIGAEGDPFPDPWLDFVVGSILSFAISLICSFFVVFAHRLMARSR